jgi:hypothetical protein
MKLFKLLLAVAGATVLLGALVSTASANHLRSSSQTKRATYPRLVFSGGFGLIECAVTIESSFHSLSITKTPGSLIGYVTRAAIGGTHCIRGSATIQQTSLPWHVRYASFAGPLPNISDVFDDITGIRMKFKESVFGIECEASGGTGGLESVREAGGVLTSERISGESPTSCGRNGIIEGTANSYTVLNSTTRITVTLI